MRSIGNVQRLNRIEFGCFYGRKHAGPPTIMQILKDNTMAGADQVTAHPE